MPSFPKPKRPSYLPKRNGNERSHRVHKSSIWRRVSKQQRQAVPECEVCVHLNGIGRLNAKLHADHIVSLRAGGAPLDRANLMSLCVEHHGRKSSMESRGYLPAHRSTLAGLIPTDRQQVIRDVAGEHVTDDEAPHGEGRA